MTRVEEIIKSLIGHVLDAALDAALEHAILQSGGPDEIKVVETEHPQAACDASETETAEHSFFDHFRSRDVKTETETQTELPQAACDVALEIETETGTELPQAACDVAFETETETETVFLDTKTEDTQQNNCGLCL